MIQVEINGFTVCASRTLVSDTCREESSKRFMFVDLKCFNHSDVSVSPTGLRRAA